MHALFSGGLPEDSALLSNSTRGTLQSTQGPCLSLPPFLSPAAAPSKCQHLFSIKRVIVSVKKKKKIAQQPVAFEHMKRNFHPSSLFDWEQWQVKMGARRPLHMTNLKLWSPLWNDCEFMPQLVTIVQRHFRPFWRTCSVEPLAEETMVPLSAYRYWSSRAKQTIYCIAESTVEYKAYKPMLQSEGTI